MLSVVRDDDARKLRRRERAAKLIERGADLTAATAGGIGGLLLGGPPGALAGTGVGLAIREIVLKLGDEFEQRQLGPRQKMRAGATLYWALTEVEERLEEGKEPRDDGFFADDVGGRSRADELLEAVLNRAINEHEERKLRHLGFMYGAFVFCEDLKPGHANFLVALASRLTWEQLVLLGLIHEMGYRALPEWPATTRFSADAQGIAGELYDLARQGIIVRTDDRPIGSVADINPSCLQCLSVGCAFVHLMRLDELDEDAQTDAYAQLAAVANEKLPEDWISRMETLVRTEPITAEDLDRDRVRVPVNDQNRATFATPGTAVKAMLHGRPRTWTVQATDDPSVAALVPVQQDREEFFAVIEERDGLWVSQDKSGTLWLD